MPWRPVNADPNHDRYHGAHADDVVTEQLVAGAGGHSEVDGGGEAAHHQIDQPKRFSVKQLGTASSIERDQLHPKHPMLLGMCWCTAIVMDVSMPLCVWLIAASRCHRLCWDSDAPTVLEASDSVLSSINPWT